VPLNVVPHCNITCHALDVLPLSSNTNCSNNMADYTRSQYSIGTNRRWLKLKYLQWSHYIALYMPLLFFYSSKNVIINVFSWLNIIFKISNRNFEIDRLFARSSGSIYTIPSLTSVRFNVGWFIFYIKVQLKKNRRHCSVHWSSENMETVRASFLTSLFCSVRKHMATLCWSHSTVRRILHKGHKFLPYKMV